MWFGPSYQPRNLLSSSIVYNCSLPWGLCPNCPFPRMFLVLVSPTSLCPSKFIRPDLQYVSIVGDLKNKVFKVGLILLWGNLDIDTYRMNMMWRDVRKRWSFFDPVEMCVSLNQETHARMFIEALFLIAKNPITQMFISWWMDKLWYTPKM